MQLDHHVLSSICNRAVESWHLGIELWSWVQLKTRQLSQAGLYKSCPLNTDNLTSDLHRSDGPTLLDLCSTCLHISVSDISCSHPIFVISLEHTGGKLLWFKPHKTK